MAYHEWRTLYPSDRKPRPVRVQNMGTEERSFCELCRLVRNLRKRGQRQTYKSVDYPRNPVWGLMFSIGDEILAVRRLS